MMFDLDTRNVEFQRLFTDIHKYWIAYADIDGYRLDAAKHVTEDFLAHFSTVIRDYARSLGKTNFFIVGEVAADIYWQGRRLGTMFSDPSNPDSHGSGANSVPASLTAVMKTLKDTYLRNPVAPFPGMNAIYDLQLSGTARDIFSSRMASDQLDEYMHGHGFRTVNSQADKRLTWQMLEIHDWPRFLYRSEAWWTFNTANAFLYTMIGQPILYYGSEQGFNGNCRLNNAQVQQRDVSFCHSAWTDVTSRQCMFVSGGFKLGSVVPEIDRLAGLGQPTLPAPNYDWRKDPFLDLEINVFTYIRRLIAIRNSCSALRRGNVQARWLEGRNNGMIVYSRLTESSEIVVIINPGGGDRTLGFVTIDARINRVGERFKSLVDPKLSGTVQRGQTGLELQFNPPYQINNWNYAIFVNENNVGTFNPSVGAALCLK